MLRIPADADEIAEAFERRWLRRVPPDAVPLYGTPEWAALSAGDPLWTASIVRAARLTRLGRQFRSIADDMHDHLAEIDRLVCERIRGTSSDVSGAADWRALAASPTHRELQRRRGEIA